MAAGRRRVVLLRGDGALLHVASGGMTQSCHGLQRLGVVVRLAHVLTSHNLLDPVGVLARVTHARQLADT
jgi:hypothetical protein